MAGGHGSRTGARRGRIAPPLPLAQLVGCPQVLIFGGFFISERLGEDAGRGITLSRSSRKEAPSSGSEMPRGLGLGRSPGRKGAEMWGHEHCRAEGS